MANEATAQTSCIQEIHEADECRENIPPGATAAAGTPKPKVQVGDVIGYSSSPASGENKPLSDMCTFATPVSSKGGVQANSRISGLQPAFTPTLKRMYDVYSVLEQRWNRPSLEPLQHTNIARQTVPFFSFANTTANCQKPTGSASQHADSVGDAITPVHWLDDESLPDITLLDVTCDSTMQLTSNGLELPDSMPVTPVSARDRRSEQVADMNPNSKMSSTLTPKMEISSVLLAEGGISSLDVTQDISTVDSLKNNRLSSDIRAQIMADDTLATPPAYIPRDMSAQCAVSQLSTSDMQCNTSSKDVTFELPVETTNPVEADNEELLASHDADLSSKVTQPILKTAGSVNSTFTTLQPSQLSTSLNTTAQMSCLMNVTQDINSSSHMSAQCAVSELSTSAMQCNASSNSVTSELPVETTDPVEANRVDKIQSSTEELSSTLNGNVTHTINSFSEQSDKCAGENMMKACLEVTRDITMDSVLDNGTPPPGLSEQNVATLQTPDEDKLATSPANVTRDINSSGDMSAQCAVSQLSTSDMQCRTSSKDVTSELLVETTDPVEADNEELLASHDADLSSKVTQPVLKTAGSVNSTFTALQPSPLSTDLNTTAQMSCLQNKTSDHPPSHVSSPTAENEATGQACSVSKNTTEPSFDMDQNSTTVKASGSSDVPNATFDKHSPQKSSSTTILGSAGATSLCLQNNTLEGKLLPKQNGTITLSETSSSDSHQKTLDEPCPPEVRNATFSPKDNKSEVYSPERLNHSRTPAGTDTNAKMIDPPESTFKANHAAEVASGAGPCETKDHSSSGFPMTDGFSDSSSHQSMHIDNNNKANAFNLDDTLDLRSDYLITSTPMNNCKTLNFNVARDEGKAMPAQKKLYGDGAIKPVGQVLSDVPSNIVCDQKTFFPQPAAKSILPPSKASQLLKFKPASILPGRFEQSGLPMTRPKTQVEVLRNTAASDAPQETTGISSSYNLRPATTGSRQPISGLRKTQLSSIPSGIQRFAPGLRPPSARSNAPASSTDKLRGPTATNPVTKASQTKKHLLIRNETSTTAKKKKMDVPLSSGCAEASTTSCNAIYRAKHLKQPTTCKGALPAKNKRDDAAVSASTAEIPTSCDAASQPKNLKQLGTSQRVMPLKGQGHGCAKCIVLLEENQRLKEENQRLKEEMLKCRKQKEEC